MSRSARAVSVFLVVASAALAATTSAQVVINEIHYHPPGTDSARLEFVELYNRGASAVDLSAWTLDMGSPLIVLPSGSSIPAGGYFVFAEQISTLAAATGYTAPTEYVGYGVNLSNGGETVTLRNNLGAVVDLVAYDDEGAWPTAPDGSGPSLELKNPALDNNLAGHPGALRRARTAGCAEQLLLQRSHDPERDSGPAHRRTEPSLGLDHVQHGGHRGHRRGPDRGRVAGDLLLRLRSGSVRVQRDAAATPGSVTIALAASTIQAAGIPFGGDSWTISSGVVVVINEIHYHPLDT